MSQPTAAEAFWDAHHHVTEDPGFWMAHPLCRAAINRRVCGDPFIWPFEAFGLTFAREPFENGLSLGCGTGALERAARTLGICDRILALDASETSLAVARSRAREKGILSITYQKADLNTVRLERARFDAVFIHQSLHHVTEIERLLDEVSDALLPKGLLFLDEWTGPSRDEWNGDRLARASALFEELPENWRRWPVLLAPVEVNDPSEAVRSSAILPAVRRILDVMIERPYGGHLVALLLPQIAREKIPEGELDRLLAAWLAMEDEDLGRDDCTSYHTALVARSRPRT